MIWLVERAVDRESKMSSLRVASRRLSFYILRLLECATRQHQTDLHGVGITTEDSKGWSILWFVERFGEEEAKVSS